MSEKENREMMEKLRQGFALSTERCLREKAMRGQMVVYGRPDGTTYVMPASEALECYLASRGS